MSTDAAASVPPLSEILASAHVVALPLVTRFRGIDVREAVVFEGPQGWTEFSPFIEYADAEASTWLAAAIDFGWMQLPAPVRDRIPVNATVPAVAASAVAEVLARFDGCRTAKVKVGEPGQSLTDDVARVRTVREIMGVEGRIRVDANGAWNVDEAEHAVHALAEVARAGAADLLVIKALPLGGVRRALQIVDQAGLPAVVSSALDTSIGLSMGAALAAALPDLDFDCGLGTASLLAGDVTKPGLLPTAGAIGVDRVQADAALLETHAASVDRREWWLERLTRCHALLLAE